MKTFQEFIAKASAELIAESIKHGVTISIHSQFVNGSAALFVDTATKHLFTADYLPESDWHCMLELGKQSIAEIAAAKAGVAKVAA